MLLDGTDGGEEEGGKLRDGEVAAGVGQRIVESHRRCELGPVVADEGRGVWGPHEGAPVDDDRLGAVVGQGGLEDQCGGAGGQPTGDLDEGSLVAPEGGEDPVGEPLSDGVLGPPQLPVGPAVAGVAGAVVGGHDPLAAGGELDLVVAAPGELGGQVAVAALQVVGHAQPEAVEVVEPLDLLGVAVEAEVGEAVAGEGEVVGEQGEGVAGGDLDAVGGVVVVGGEQVGEEVVFDGLDIGDDLLGSGAVVDGLGDDLLLGRGAVGVHEPGDVAEGAHGLGLLVDEALDDAQVAPQGLGAGRGEQVADDGGGILAEAVDAAVALLEGDERPGHVVVHEVVAGVVQVEPLAGSIGAEEQADVALAVVEVLDEGVLLLVGLPTVEDGDGGGGPLAVVGFVDGGLGEAVAGGELVAEEVQGVDALGEHDDALARLAGGVAELVEEAEQALQLGLLGRGGFLGEGEQGAEHGEVVVHLHRGVALLELGDAAPQGLLAGRR